MTAEEAKIQSGEVYLCINEDMLSAADSLIRETTESSNALAKEINAFISEIIKPIADMQRTFASMVEEQYASAIHCQQTFDSMSDIIEPILVELRKSEALKNLGLVPHPTLHQYTDEILARSQSGAQVASEETVADVWRVLRPQLRRSLDDCLGDEKTATMFNQLMRAHEAGLYDLTAPGAASLIERAARLAQVGCAPIKTKTWMEDRVADVPASELRAGVPIWQVLKEQTFAGCSDDTTADGMTYLNRHAAAHGLGARVSNQVDSLNAVLLAHFAVLAAKAVKRCAEE